MARRSSLTPAQRPFRMHHVCSERTRGRASWKISHLWSAIVMYGPSPLLEYFIPLSPNKYSASEMYAAGCLGHTAQDCTRAFGAAPVQTCTTLIVGTSQSQVVTAVKLYLSFMS